MHSAGLLQIVAAGERSSVAVVVYACDELRKAIFSLGLPAYYDAARILFADEGRDAGRTAASDG